MAKKTKNVYLPRWYRYVMVPMMVLMWLFVTYMEYFSTSANKDELGPIGYAFMTVLFLGLSVMFWLMTGGKLPAYIIKEDD